MSNKNNNNNDDFINNEYPVVPVPLPTAPLPIIQAELVPETSNHNATPTEYFTYNDETLRNDNHPQPEYQPNYQSQSQHPTPIAPAFTNIGDDSPAAQEQTVSWKTRFGSDMGRIQAVEEKEKIRRISANAKGLPYFESQRVKASNKIAKKRVKEGFDEKVDNYFDESGLLCARRAAERDSLSKENNNNTGTGSGSGNVSGDQEGYQVGEYNVQDYDCEEYQTTEYKSVYD
jgi:hypothetical protein